MSALEAIDYTADGADEAFVTSLRETGFGVLRHHPLDVELVARIYREWDAFFESGEAREWTVDKNTQDGYFAPEEAESAKGFDEQDIKEYYHYYSWGRCPAALKPDLERYYAAAHDLAATLLAWVETYTPDRLSDHFSEPLSAMMRDSDMTLLRILRYPPLTGAEKAVWAAPHQDINLLTILPLANAPGLQVLGKAGDWINVPTDPDIVVVNIGDMLQEVTHGYFPSTTHRVINPAGEAPTGPRMSMPLFLHPRPDVQLSHRYTAGAYLAERLEELGVV